MDAGGLAHTLKPLARDRLIAIDVDPKITPHVLRHTFAATALQKGISLATMQKILGHDRLQTTAIYLNFTDTHIQEEFERKW